MNNETIQIDRNAYHFNVDIYVFQERENYISYCPSLDICSAGKDFNDAIKNFYEAFELYADYWEEHGTLEADLKSHGWEVENRSVKPPQPQSLLSRPMFLELLSGQSAFERVVSPVHVSAR